MPSKYERLMGRQYAPKDDEDDEDLYQIPMFPKVRSRAKAIRSVKDSANWPVDTANKVEMIRDKYFPDGRGGRVKITNVPPSMAGDLLQRAGAAARGENVPKVRTKEERRADDREALGRQLKRRNDIDVEMRKPTERTPSKEGYGPIAQQRMAQRMHEMAQDIGLSNAEQLKTRNRMKRNDLYGSMTPREMLAREDSQNRRRLGQVPSKDYRTTKREREPQEEEVPKTRAAAVARMLEHNDRMERRGRTADVVNKEQRAAQSELARARQASGAADKFPVEYARRKQARDTNLAHRRGVLSRNATNEAIKAGIIDDEEKRHMENLATPEYAKTAASINADLAKRAAGKNKTPEESLMETNPEIAVNIARGKAGKPDMTYKEESAFRIGRGLEPNPEPEDPAADAAKAAAAAADDGSTGRGIGMTLAGGLGLAGLYKKRQNIKNALNALRGKVTPGIGAPATGPRQPFGPRPGGGGGGAPPAGPGAPPVGPTRPPFGPGPTAPPPAGPVPPTGPVPGGPVPAGPVAGSPPAPPPAIRPPGVGVPPGPVMKTPVATPPVDPKMAAVQALEAQNARAAAAAAAAVPDPLEESAKQRTARAAKTTASKEAAAEAAAAKRAAKATAKAGRAKYNVAAASVPTSGRYGYGGPGPAAPGAMDVPLPPTVGERWGVGRPPPPPSGGGGVMPRPGEDPVADAVAKKRASIAKGLETKARNRAAAAAKAAAAAAAPAEPAFAPPEDPAAVAKRQASIQKGLETKAKNRAAKKVIADAAAAEKMLTPTAAAAAASPAATAAPTGLRAAAAKAATAAAAEAAESTGGLLGKVGKAAKQVRNMPFISPIAKGLGKVPYLGQALTWGPMAYDVLKNGPSWQGISEGIGGISDDMFPSRPKFIDPNVQQQVQRQAQMQAQARANPMSMQQIQQQFEDMQRQKWEQENLNY